MTKAEYDRLRKPADDAYRTKQDAIVRDYEAALSAIGPKRIGIAKIKAAYKAASHANHLVHDKAISEINAAFRT